MGRGSRSDRAAGWATDWAAEAFGEQVEELRQRIPGALAAAHRRARAGHDAGQSRNQRVYGTALWEYQHEELVAAIRPVSGAKVARFGAYELPVLAGKVLFPLKYTEKVGVPVEEARLEKPVSGLRERLFGAHAKLFGRRRSRRLAKPHGLKRSRRSYASCPGGSAGP